jgi:1-deoxy-D-xylulose-5-phosphate reductoisomerase
MKLAILGSTGSIGTSALAVVQQHPGRFEVVGLAAGGNVELLAQQAALFRPRVVCLADAAGRDRLAGLLAGTPGPEILTGQDGMERLATLGDVDVVIAAIAGAAGLVPTLAAVRAGKTVALANKEALVMAGALMVAEARRAGARIIPVDSEHSAIYQLLHSQSRRDVRNIILTASGGPFLEHTQDALDHVTPDEALRHPRWKMGHKVTTDSASLMNKGLEVIEAHWLFGVPAERIQVVIHPQSIIHSMVEFVDGTVFAQLSQPDMRAPIAYALSCPERLADVVPPLDFARLGSLTFRAPDERRFPTLRLAYDALAAGGLMPAVMNAANEVAVMKFHEKAIRFTGIPRLTGMVMERFTAGGEVTLESILRADQWARDEALRLCRQAC